MLRAALLAALIVQLPLRAGAQEVITKKLCGEIASGVGTRAAEADRVYEGFSSSSIHKLQPHTQGAMKDAIERSEIARQKILPLLKEYSAAMEDLSYQLRVCAR